MRWWQAPFFAVGIVLGAATILAAMAFTLVVVVLHRISFVLCSIGLHELGCWIRRNMTTPVLEIVSVFCKELRAARKNSSL